MVTRENSIAIICISIKPEECVCGHLLRSKCPILPYGKEKKCRDRFFKTYCLFFLPLRDQNKGFGLFVLCENACVTWKFSRVRTQINPNPLLPQHTVRYTPVPARALISSAIWMFEQQKQFHLTTCEDCAPLRSFCVCPRPPPPVRLGDTTLAPRCAPLLSPLPCHFLQLGVSLSYIL